MNLNFRTLRPNEIDVRIGSVAKDNSWVTLLLYKDARVDMTLLDETVGPMNWQRRHCRDNANCIVSIWDDDKRCWIEKEDTGTESNTEAAKGLASDSFKRACVCVGIGRELYTAPTIFIKGDADKLKKTRFKVTAIDYDETRTISRLIIVDNKGVPVFEYDCGANKPNVQRTHAKVETAETFKQSEDDPAKQKADLFRKLKAELGLNNGQVEKCRVGLVAEGVVEDKSSADMTVDEVKVFCENCVKVYGKAAEDANR